MQRKQAIKGDSQIHSLEQTIAVFCGRDDFCIGKVRFNILLGGARLLPLTELFLKMGQLLSMIESRFRRDGDNRFVLASA